MDKEIKSIEDIFADDFFREFIMEKPKPKQKTTDDRLVEEFLEINNFYEKNQKIPEKSRDISERILFSRLKGFVEDVHKRQYLSRHDTHNIFAKFSEKYGYSYEEKNSEDIGNTEEASDDIFDLKFVEKYNPERASADFVARREACPDFEKYEPLFQGCHNLLNTKEGILIDYEESQLKEGTFGLLNGMLFYIAKIEDGVRGNSQKINRRTLIVFENGTQSNMLLRSLGKAMWGGKKGAVKGKIIVSNSTKTQFENMEVSGYIYILESLSEKTEIADIKNLYKIGFSTTPVEERIKNAKNDTTYLMSDVRIIATYKAYNLNVQKFERIIHRVLGETQLHLEIFDADGMSHSPREWFVVPFGIIDDIIQKIISGEIEYYFYDKNSETLRHI